MYNYFIFKSKFSLNFHLFVSFKEKFDFRCFQKTKSDLITYFPKNKIWSHHIFSKNKIWSYHIFSKKQTYFPKNKHFPKNKIWSYHIFKKKQNLILSHIFQKNKNWSYHLFPTDIYILKTTQSEGMFWHIHIRIYNTQFFPSVLLQSHHK